jgi:hypothetical protein
MAGILQAKKAGYPLGSLHFQDFDKLTLILNIASHRLEAYAPITLFSSPISCLGTLNYAKLCLANKRIKP